MKGKYFVIQLCNNTNWFGKFSTPQILRIAVFNKANPHPALMADTQWFPMEVFCNVNDNRFVPRPEFHNSEIMNNNGHVGSHSRYLANVDGMKDKAVDALVKAGWTQLPEHVLIVSK